MATQVPRVAAVEVPAWFFGGNVPEFFRQARLAVKAPIRNVRSLRVEAFERAEPGRRPNLVSVRDQAGPPVGRPDFSVLMDLDAAQDAPMTAQVASNVPDRSQEFERALSDVYARIDRSASAREAFSAAAVADQLRTMNASSAELPSVVRDSWQRLRDVRKAEDQDKSAFPDASAHFIRRSEALILRTKLAAIMLRIDHDEQLRSADLASLQAANARGELVFAAASSLNEGVMLLDAYLAPLLGAMTPFVWAYPATRAAGTVIYALGNQISSTDSVAIEPLHLLPARAAERQSRAPDLYPHSATQAITWWARRLDKILSVMSDPAIYTDQTGRYVPSKHLHAQLSVDQLFRRVGSIQRSHRDTDARRVLLFTVLDTLERLTSRTLIEMCTLSFAEKILRKLRKSMPRDAAALLLPNAERAIAALRDLQGGFFAARQSGSNTVRFTDADGREQMLDLQTAAAQYVRVVRNATHGHGSDHESQKLRTDALLAQHDGGLPHDLGLLGWLYLLDLMSNPVAFRNTVYDGGRV